MNINAVLNFDTADFTHELKSATKVKKTPTKKKNLIRRGIVPTLVTDYGCGKVALNFGENRIFNEIQQSQNEFGNLKIQNSL